MLPAPSLIFAGGSMYRNEMMRFARTARHRATSFVGLWTLFALSGASTVLAQQPGYPIAPRGDLPGYAPSPAFPRPGTEYQRPGFPAAMFPGGPIEGANGPTQPPRQGLVVNGREAAALARETSNSCTVAILGAVQQPGVYRFEQRTVEPIELIRAAGGPSAGATPSIQVIRMGARVPQQRTAMLSPQLKLPLETNDLVVLHRAEAFGARQQSESQLDALGRPVYRDTNSTARGNGSQPLVPVRVGILGVADHPLVFELHPEQANLAAVLSRLNQDGNRQATALVLTPGQPQAIVAWGDSGTTAVKDGSLLLFKGDEIDTEALPEFPSPRLAGAGTAASGDATPPAAHSVASASDQTRPTGPIVLNSPFVGNGRNRSSTAAQVVPLGEAAPGGVAAGMIAQAGNEEPDDGTARPSRGPRLDGPPANDLVVPQIRAAEAAPGTATRPHPTEVHRRRSGVRVAGNPANDGYSEALTLPTPDEPPLPGDHPVRSVLPEETSALHEEPERVPTRARISITDESQLDRIPAPAGLGAGDLVGERLPPPPAADIDPLTAGRPVEVQGIIVAALALSGVLIGLWIAAQPHRVPVRPAVTTSAPLLDRLERLIANSLPVQDERTPVPGDITLYGRVAPMADQYLIDPAQNAPAPHFPEPAVRPTAAPLSPSAAVSPPVRTAGGESAAPSSSKVVRLDGSHPAGVRQSAHEPGLLDRALLSKQSTSRGPTS